MKNLSKRAHLIKSHGGHMAAAQVLGVKPSLADKMGGAVRLTSGEQTSCKPVHVLGPRVLV